MCIHFNTQILAFHPNSNPELQFLMATIPYEDYDDRKFTNYFTVKNYIISSHSHVNITVNSLSTTVHTLQCTADSRASP